MVIERVRHTVNGKLIGFLFRFENSRNLYFVVRPNASKALDVATNSWCIENDLIRYAERMSCAYIGVAHKVGTEKYDYYIARLEDFLGEPSERHFGAKTPSRRLNRYKFRARVSKYGKRALVAMEEARLTV